MKKIIIITLGLASMLIMDGCRKCKNIEHIERAKQMTEYFGNYKPDAYWIYLNRDSTKRDSICVDNFTIWEVRDELKKCLKATAVKFDVHSDFFYAKKMTLGFNGSDVETNVLYTTDSNGKEYYGIQASNSNPSFFNLDINFPDSYNYQLWPNNANTIYDIVTITGSRILSPNLGIIQFSTVDQQDTFSLIKYYIS